MKGSIVLFHECIRDYITQRGHCQVIQCNNARNIRLTENGYV